MSDGFRQCYDRDHFDPHSRAGQGDAAGRASWWGITIDPLIPDGIHALEICHVGKPDLNRRNVGFVSAQLFDDSVQLGQNLPCLFGYVSPEVIWDLSGKKCDVTDANSLAHAGAGV
jgi:hypothetical protein